MKIGLKTLLAREEALEECMVHLELAWTDDQTERIVGEWLIKKLKKIQDKLVDARIKLRHRK